MTNKFNFKSSNVPFKNSEDNKESRLSFRGTAYFRRKDGLEERKAIDKFSSVYAILVINIAGYISNLEGLTKSNLKEKINLNEIATIVSNASNEYIIDNIELESIELDENYEKLKNQETKELKIELNKRVISTQYNNNIVEYTYSGIVKYKTDLNDEEKEKLELSNVIYENVSSILDRALNLLVFSGNIVLSDDLKDYIDKINELSNKDEIIFSNWKIVSIHIDKIIKYDRNQVPEEKTVEIKEDSKTKLSKTTVTNQESITTTNNNANQVNKPEYKPNPLVKLFGFIIVIVIIAVIALILF